MLNMIVSGIVTGLLYALVGQSMVVVYRTTKVLNFALGGQGLIVAYLSYEMLRRGVPYWVVFPAAIIIGALLGGILERLVVYPLRRQPVLTIAIATLGVLLTLEGIALWGWGNDPKSMPAVLAGAGGFQAGDFGISYSQIFIIVVAIAATALMLYLIERTKLGLGMRATSSGPLTASILGVNTGSMRFSSWALGGAYGAIAALLVTPLTFLSPTSFISFLLTAIAAVVLGGFTNIVGVVIGSIIYGIGTNMLVAYGQNDLVATFTFVSVALVLLLRPHGIFGKPERELSEPEIASRRRRRSIPSPARRRASGPAPAAPLLTPRTKRTVSSIGWAVALVALIVPPFVGGSSTVYLVGIILATYIAVIGQNVITGYSGEVSLASSGLALIGAYTFTISLRAELPFAVALLLALVASGIVGALIGLMAARVSGIYLVVLTLLFLFVIPEMIAKFPAFTGGVDGLPVVVPGLLDQDVQYWIVLGIAAAVTAITVWVAAGRTGRNWRAVRDSANGARALGLNPSGVKLGAFVYGSALAGLAGALTAFLTGFISPESFAVFWAIYVLLAVVLGGTGSIGGSLIGAAFIVWVPRSVEGLPVPLIFGLAMIVVLLVAPGGVAGLYQRVLRAAIGRFGRKGALVHVDGLAGDDLAAGTSPAGSPHRHDAAPAQTTERADAAVSASAGSGAATPDAVLTLDSVSTGYGAGMVLRGLSFDVRPGEMVTLLGANGAGKSTVLRTISGILPVMDGSVSWRGAQIGARGLHHPAAIARSGLAHVPEGRGIFPDLTVLENLRLGRFADAAQSNGEFATRMEEVFGYFPILKERLKQAGGTLSGGEQQMLAIARALMSSPALLMLDEPSLGLSPLYSQQVLDNLRRIVDEKEGVSVLLIEQNARAALERSDRAYVISRGAVALEGTSHELLTNHDLSELYLAVEA